VESLGKKLELKWRRIRSYFSLRDINTYRKYSRSKPSSPSAKPIACFDFTSPKIDLDAGRYTYLIIKDFIESGYEVHIAKRFYFFASFERKRFKTLLFRETYQTYNPKTPPQKASILITDSTGIANLWTKTNPATTQVLLSYTNRPDTKDASPPYYAHPFIVANQLLKNVSTENQRPVTTCFAGNVNLPSYDKPIIQQLFGVMTRWKTIDLVNRYYKDKTTAISDNSFTTPLPKATYASPPLNEKLHVDNYLALLKSSRFYIACPGTSFAISHNLVESMLSGCVPIMQYGHHLNPPLEDGLHCLSFQDEHSLHACLKKAEQMSQESWKTLQKNSLAYAHKYFKSGSFSHKVKESSHVRKQHLHIFEFITPRF